MLGLNTEGATLSELAAEGAAVCALSADELEARFGPWAGVDKHGVPLKHRASEKVTGNAQQLCFLAAYSFAMLHHGHGFELDRPFAAVETMVYEGANLKAAPPSPPLLPFAFFRQTSFSHFALGRVVLFLLLPP